MSLKEHIQGGSLGAEIILYKIDLSMFNEADLFLTNGTDSDGTPISFGGQVYSPLPIVADGFKMKTSGPLPRPKIKISNISNAFTAIVSNNDDLLGAILTRIRTYDRYLDGHPDADSTKKKPEDIYEFNDLTLHTRSEVAWQMRALMDQEGTELPGRRIIKDYCDHTYRKWNGSAFDYSKATCPYVGSASYDELDASTTSANDRCSKRLGACQLRFGANAALPTRAFPGTSRLRTR